MFFNTRLFNDSKVASVWRSWGVDIRFWLELQANDFCLDQTDNGTKALLVGRQYPGPLWKGTGNGGILVEIWIAEPK